MSLIGFSRDRVPPWDRYEVWSLRHGFWSDSKVEARAARVARDLSKANRGERFEVRLVKGRPGVGPSSALVAAFRNGEEVV